jgi:hypothetical protein
MDNIKPKPSNQVRAVIFAQGRTGSTLLENLLCSTGHFRNNGELLNTDNGRNEIIFPAKYIRGLSKWERDSNFIFHVKIYQLTRDRKKPVDPTSFLRALNYDGFKIIALRRKNIVKHTLSNLVAQHRGNYEKIDDKKEKLRLVVDCKEFSDAVKERIGFSKEEKSVLANFEYHEVVYEDDLENSNSHQKTIDKILDFLSLEKRKVTTKLRKVNTTPLEQLITNYDEFFNCIRKNGWEHYC